MATGIMMIYSLAFIKDLFIEEKLINCNANVISLKARSFIEMPDPEDYKEADLCMYQRLAGKLMYFLFSIRPNVVFIIK